MSDKAEVIQTIRDIGIIPVVRAQSAAEAMKAIDAIRAGARGLKRCFGLEAAIVTALADNAVGRLVQDLIYQGGVDQSHLKWVKFDGVGRTVRNGLNFTERGFGVRGAAGCSDRGHTAVSRLRPGDIDWDKVFAQEGARWFHTGGIFCALSETTPATLVS